MNTPVWICASCGIVEQGEPPIEHSGCLYCSENCWKLDQSWRDAAAGLERVTQQRNIAVGYCLVMGLLCVIFAAVAWDSFTQYNGWLRFQQIMERPR